MMCALHDCADAGRSVRVRFLCVPDEESEDVERPLHRRARARAASRGDFAITGEPTDLHIGVQAKGVLAMRARGARARRARLDAVAGRQRRPEGARRLPPNRVAAVRARVLRAVRPPLDQPRADPGRRRAQQGARPLRDGRRHPLPARPGPGRRSSRRSARCPDVEVVRTFIRAPAIVVAHEPVRARAARRASAALDERRGDERRARRRLRRDLVPRGRHPGGRVRPGRRRPPRPGGVGLDLLAARATARRSSTSCARCPAGSPARRGRRRLRAVEGGLRVSRELRDEPPARRAAACSWRARARRRCSIVAADAPARVSAAVLLQVDDVVDDPRAQGRARSSIPRDHARREAGKPQTILILGSDRRYGDKKRGAEAALGHDHPRAARPRQGAIALMSIPRDLRSTIPGHGDATRSTPPTRSAARALTLKTVKQLLSTPAAVPDQPRRQRQLPRLPAGGRRVGCVYVDVDRRYFNDNVGGGRAATRTINIQPGYQKLCGQDALDYVRYRHTDNDIVRAARQQDFLRQVRSQVSVRKQLLRPSNRSKLREIFGRYTHSTRPAHDQADLLAAASSRSSRRSKPDPARSTSAAGSATRRRRT